MRKTLVCIMSSALMILGITTVLAEAAPATGVTITYCHDTHDTHDTPGSHGWHH